MPRFITKATHAYIDYPVAIALIIMPSILGIGANNSMAAWLSVATGVAAFILTFLTDHETGVVKVLPYKFHLAVDFSVAIIFLTAPLVLGFAGLELWYFTVLGAAVMLVVGLHKPEQAMVATA